MKKYLKKIAELLVVNSLCLVGLTSCMNYSETNVISLREQEGEIKLGVVVYNQKDPFIREICYYIKEETLKKEESSKSQINLEVIDGENSQKLQDEKINKMFTESFDAIAVNIVDRSQASGIIDKAKEKGIPLVFFNREPVPQDMEKWEKVYYIGSKAEQAGKMQGEILIKAIEQNPDIDRNKDGILQYVMLEGEQGHQDAILRSYHSIKVLEDHQIKMENLSSDTGAWDRELAKEKMRGWIEAYGEEIEVVLANNDEMALGAIEVLEEVGFYESGKEMGVLGVDGLEEGMKAIEEGRMLGTVINNAEVQGKYVFDTLYELAIGIEPYNMKEEFEAGKYLWAPHEKVDRENVEGYLEP